MSYDMSIGDETFGYTYNVSPMWRDGYPDRGIRAHYGMTGRDSLPVLRTLRDHLEGNHERLLAMNPSNGWGDYYGALAFVHSLIMAAMRHPDQIWEGD
ncbi:MAG: hypothetical protein EA401_14290 [Planctomycetota bacterium]|nr:MAG: hypothetical protein EA401_14290 [Planctomycetota bacterium]